jgi:hypothetical protein
MCISIKNFSRIVYVNKTIYSRDIIEEIVDQIHSIESQLFELYHNIR